MADATYIEDLLRLILAHAQLQSAMQVGQQMYGKGYFALGAGERAVVDRAAFEMTLNNYKAITVESLVNLDAPMPQQAEKQTAPMGFVNHPAEAKTESSPPRTSGRSRS